MSKVITKMKKRRIEKGYTHDYMAQRLGYASKSGYAMLETGQNNISLPLGIKIAEILELQVQELLDEVEVHDSTTFDAAPSI